MHILDRVSWTEFLGTNIPEEYIEAAKQAVPDKCLEMECKRARHMAVYCASDGFIEEICAREVSERTTRMIGTICDLCVEAQLQDRNT